jgi:phytoene/squalene synthetase
MREADELDDTVSSAAPGSLADKLTRLLDQCINPADGRPYSLPAISRQINDMIDQQFANLPAEQRRRRKVSRGYLWELKTGRKDNPALNTLQSLAAYLNVTVGYLSDIRVVDGARGVPAGVVRLPPDSRAVHDSD